MRKYKPDNLNDQDDYGFDKARRIFKENIAKGYQFDKLKESNDIDKEPSKINNKTIDINLSKIIIDELKRFDEEDLILIFDEVIKATDTTKDNILNGFSSIEKYPNFQKIKIDLIEQIIEIKNITKVKKIFDNVRELKKKAVPLNFLKDAKNDHRLCNFSYNFTANFSKNPNKKFYYFENPYLNINHLVMVRSEFTSSRYPTIIRDSQKIFVSEIRIKNISKKFDDKKFNEWAYDYLLKNNLEFCKMDYHPLNQNQRANLIISFLDYLAYFKKEEHAVLTTKLYRAWNQKKFRESKKIVPNPYSSLSKDIRSYLKNIAKKEGKTEKDVLSDLICDKYLMLELEKTEK